MIYQHQLSIEGRRFGALSTHAEIPDNPLLCLHGWLDNAASFQPLMLAAPTLPWLAIDWPGHGLSEHRAGHYHLVEYVDDLYAVQRALQLERLSLIGHSLGGIVASMYAGSFPEKVAHLLSVEAVGPMAWDGAQAPPLLRHALISRRKQRAVVSRYVDLEAAVAARIAAQPCLPPAAAELLVQRNLICQQTHWSWRSDPDLRTLSALRVTPDQAEAWCRAVTCPTLIVEGRGGYASVKQAVAERLGWFQQASRVVLEGGHHLHMERPDALLKLINGLVYGQ